MRCRWYDETGDEAENVYNDGREEGKYAHCCCAERARRKDYKRYNEKRGPLVVTETRLACMFSFYSIHIEILRCTTCDALL